MKYAVDRVEDNIIILQDLNTKEIKEINKKELTFEVNDGDILSYENKKYFKNNNEKEEKLRIIKEKLDKLKELH